MFIVNWWAEAFTTKPNHLVIAAAFLTIGVGVWVLRELWLGRKQRRLEKQLRDNLAKADGVWAQYCKDNNDALEGKSPGIEGAGPSSGAERS